MKKVVFVLLLLALCGTVFFLGWVQFKVPPGSVGVVRSKTHDTDPKIVRPGAFRWVWYAVIPTNVSVVKFKLPASLSAPLELKGSLPSGDVYAAFAGLHADFSYDVSGAAEFQLKPDALPALAQKYNMAAQDDLDAYLKKIADEVAAYARQRLADYAKDSSALAEIAGGRLARLESDLAANFPDAENFAVKLGAAKFPDLALYGQAAALYGDYLEAQRKSLRGEVAQLSSDSLALRQRLDELSQYGILLEKYPILLNYLALEKGIKIEE